jgi:hypothetical protein
VRIIGFVVYAKRRRCQDLTLELLRCVTDSPWIEHELEDLIDAGRLAEALDTYEDALLALVDLAADTRVDDPD